MQIELIIFDCDGVIADSELLSEEALIAELALVGMAVTPDEVRRDFLGRSFPTVAASLHRRFGRPLPEGFEAAYRARLLARFEAALRETPGFAAMLAGLAGRRVCVATSSSPARVGRTLQLLGLEAAFGADVFTASQVARGKPAPDLFLFAAGQMGCPPERALVIEDSAAGLAAAHAAGMRVLHYAGGAHLAGQPAPEGVRSFSDWRDFPALLEALEGAAA